MVVVTEQQQQQTGVESSGFDDESCKDLGTLITTTSERKHALMSQKKTIAIYRGVLKTHVEEGERLENEVQNLEVQIQEIQNKCTDFVLLDCCQVYKSHLSK